MMYYFGKAMEIIGGILMLLLCGVADADQIWKVALLAAVAFGMLFIGFCITGDYAEEGGKS